MIDGPFKPAGTCPGSTNRVCYNPKHKCKDCDHHHAPLDLCCLNWAENCDHYFGRRGGRKGCFWRQSKLEVEI